MKLPRPFCALFLVVVSTACAADSVVLLPQWQVGKRYFQVMSMEQHMSFSIGAQAVKQDMTNVSDITMTVSQHPDGKSKRVGILYGHVRMNMSMNGQQMSYDSDKPDPAADPLGVGKSLGVLVGKEVHVVLDEKNHVTAVENVDELMKAVPPGPGAAMMQQMLSKETFAQMIEQGSLRSLPPGPVKPGDTWPVTFEMNLPQVGKISLTGTYTYKGTAPHNGVPCAEIAIDAKLAMDLAKDFGGSASSDTAQAIQKLGMKFEGGTVTGTTWFDPALGFARDAQIKQNMIMHMTNPTDPTKTVEMPMEQNIGVTLTKVEDVK